MSIFIFTIIKRLFLFLFLSTSVTLPVFSQLISFDSQTGNYTLEYFDQEKGRNEKVVFDPPTKFKPNIDAKCEFEKDDLLFRFTYQIANLDFSTQSIVAVNIPLTLRPQQLTDPGGWFHLYSGDNPTVAWITKSKGIDPGEKLDGISIQCRLLPGVSKLWLTGNAPPVVFPDEPAQGIVETLDLVRKREENRYVEFQSIGPDATLESADPSNLVTRLIDLSRQAVKIKWISNSVSISQVEKHLKKAKDAVTAKKEYVGRAWLEQLNNFLEEEKKERSKNLTDNGYYLLKPNIDFILTKLPKEPKNGSERREAEKIRKNAK